MRIESSQCVSETSHLLKCFSELGAYPLGLCIAAAANHYRAPRVCYM